MDQPLMNLSWKEKVADNKKWFRNWIDYLTADSRLDLKNENQRKDYDVLYGVYNNQFPSKWFKNTTNPGAKNKDFRNFPAQVRPINYLRTNIDLLLGEFLQRPIKFTVTTSGSYTRYMEGLNKQANEALLRLFNEIVEAEDPQQVPIPDLEAMESLYKTSWRDKLSIRAQRKLTEIVKQYKIKRELLKCKKDYLVVGEAYTYKGLLPNGKFMYHRISPKAIRYDMTTLSDMVNKANWVTCRYHLSAAEVSDMFWDELSDEDLKEIDRSISHHPADRKDLYEWFIRNNYHDKIAVDHVQWRARRKILKVAGIDPETGIPYEFEADEDYVPGPNETYTHYWKTEINEGWKIHVGKGIYTGMRNLPYLEDLSYNGRVYSNTESNSMSIMEMGIPIQIMLMLVHWKLEMTIVQSKNKIVLIDKNTIPRGDGWDEERFFYYAEAKGWAIMDRSQAKVDRTWNQYQVLDLTLYDRIAQLVEISQYLMQSWDDLLGISRLRKGATAASDAVGVTQQGLVQSNIITDIIFYTFEELIEDELNGLAELSRLADAMGTPVESWMLADFDKELAAIDPLEASLEKQNVYIEFNSDQLRKLAEIKQYANSMLQNNQQLSTIIDVIASENLAELKAKVLAIEAKAMEQAQQAQAQEAEIEERMLELQQEAKEFEHILDLEFMNAEYDRKEDLSELEGYFNTFTYQDGDANDNGVPDATEIQKLLQKKQAEDTRAKLKREELKQQREQQRAELDEKREKRKSDEKVKLAQVAATKVKARAAAKKKASK